MNQEEQREAHILVLVNNADFDREVAYQLFDDAYKDEMFDWINKKYPEDIKQAWMDDVNPKEFVADLIFESISFRNFYRTELTELVDQWLDGE